MQSVSEQQVHAGKLPERMALEGVRLRYVVDCHLDEILAQVYTSITTPPLLPYPLGKVMSTIRVEACKMELWNQSTQALCAVQKNDLTLIGSSGCFIYAGQSLSH